MNLTKEEIDRLDRDVDDYFKLIETSTEGQFPFLINDNDGEEVHLPHLEGVLLNENAIEGFVKKIQGI